MTKVTVTTREQSTHPELIDDSSLAPPPRVLRKHFSMTDWEFLINGIDTNASQLMEQEESPDHEYEWRVGKQEKRESKQSLEYTLSNLPSKTDSETIKTSYNIGSWLVDALEEVEENHSTNLSWRDLTRGIVKKAHVLLNLDSSPGEVVALTSAIRDMQSGVSVSGLYHYSLSSDFTYEKDKARKVTFEIENQAYKDFCKLFNRLNWEKTQGFTFALCLGLTKSDTLAGKAVMDRLNQHAQEGLGELQTARKVGARQYTALLDHLANEPLSRKQQRRMFRQLRKTHKKSSNPIPPERLWVKMWWKAVRNPVPKKQKERLGISAIKAEYTR